MAYNKTNNSNAKSIEDADLEKVTGGGSTDIKYNTQTNQLEVNMKFSIEDLIRLLDNKNNPLTGEELAEILGLDKAKYNSILDSFGRRELPIAE